MFITILRSAKLLAQQVQHIHAYQSLLTIKQVNEVLAQHVAGLTQAKKQVFLKLCGIIIKKFF